MHRDAFGEGSDAPVPGTGVDLVADRELTNEGTDLNDCACHVVSERERKRIVQELFELTRANLLVELVQAGRLHLHKHVMIADSGFRRRRFLQRSFVCGECECSHG